jgi:hypothetical protein
MEGVGGVEIRRGKIKRKKKKLGVGIWVWIFSSFFFDMSTQKGEGDSN